MHYLDRGMCWIYDRSGTKPAQILPIEAYHKLRDILFLLHVVMLVMCSELCDYIVIVCEK